MAANYYARAMTQALATPRGAPPKVLMVLGPRQAGKSTLLAHYLAPRRGVMTVNLQDRRVRQRYERDQGLLVREVEAATDIRTVFIDEIQKIPGLLEDVQYLHDTHRGKYAVYVTGSSARQLKRRAANLLPGRAHLCMLSPVLQAEQRACELLPVRMGNDVRFPVRRLEEYLLYGNLPGLYHEDRASWQATLQAYAELYVENEIRQEGVVNDMGAFLRFLRLAALEAGQYVNHTRLARDVGVAVNTLRNFYQVLEDTYVGLRLAPFSRRRKRIIEAPRFLIFDTGVRHVLADVPPSNTLLTLDAGRIFEQWVLIELYYRCVYHGAGHQLSTWRTATGAEVDAVLETPDECMPIEIKWTQAPTAQDARHLETFLEQHRDISTRGYVICRAPRRQQLTRRVVALPWNEF
jgi:predicted AAA+ superfamily ATPase